MQPLAGSCRRPQAAACLTPGARGLCLLIPRVPATFPSSTRACRQPPIGQKLPRLAAAWKPGSLEAGACHIEVAMLLPCLAFRSLHLVSSCWPLVWHPVSKIPASRVQSWHPGFLARIQGPILAFRVHGRHTTLLTLSRLVGHSMDAVQLASLCKLIFSRLHPYDTSQTPQTCVSSVRGCPREALGCGA